MRSLFKYLKPNVAQITVCLILLFVQAMTNLYLPNYMADIIDVGIQKYGISEVAPSAISDQGFNFLQSFMDNSEKQTVNDNYTLIKSGSSEAKNYENQYPLVKSKDIYIKNNIDDKSVQESIDEAFCRSIMSFIYFMQEFSAGNSSDTSLSMSDTNIEDIYKFSSVIEATPQSQIDLCISRASEQSISQLSSTASTMCKLFYTELGMDVSKIQSDYIWQVGIMMLVLTFAGAVCAILVGLIAARLAASVSRNIRHDVFEKVQYFSSAEFDKFSTASLITRTTNDITQIQDLIVMGIRILCYAPILGIGGTILAISESLSMSWIIVLSVILVLGIMLLAFVVTMPKYKIIQKITDKINLITRENLSGIMVIRAFGTQKYEEKRFDKVNRQLTDVNLFVNRIMGMLHPAMTLIMNVFCVIVIWFGGHEVEKSALEVGSMMEFMQYTMMIITSFLMISIMFIMVPRSAVSMNRIEEVLNTSSSVIDKKNTVRMNLSKEQAVEFKNVSFKYGSADEYVLNDISFKAKPGETTAFIGSTGSGKSTLINLIPRFYDVTKGSISIGGVDIRDISQKELRDNIGFVPQKGMLFSGTISSNLHYGDETASDNKLYEAAEIAQSIDFIEKKADKFESAIAQGGGNVSGGQKQRLCIARALVKTAPIYIFDDSFSALDFKTDSALRKALKNYTKNSVVLIVAQRVSTIMNAEQIIVLDEGKIVGKGTHRELLNTCETYKAIATSQLSKEELLK